MLRTAQCQQVISINQNFKNNFCVLLVSTLKKAKAQKKNKKQQQGAFLTNFFYKFQQKYGINSSEKHKNVTQNAYIWHSL